MKVGFYLQNESLEGVDLSNPEMGNPGVGGTEFLTVSLPYYFNKYVPDQITPILFANNTNNLPKEVSVVQADNVVEALREADESNLDFLVWRPVIDEYGEKLVSTIDSYNVGLVCWMHNITSAKFLHKIHKKDQLSGFVFVGREQLDTLRDCGIFYDSTFIYNGFDTKYYEPTNLGSGKNTVTFIGSIVPTKGFHILAQLWPTIKQAVPDAELCVIGTGRLYNRNQTMGRWGVAEEEYEQQFRPYLSNDYGEPMDSVTFHGLVDTEEKIRILQNSTVGIANPSGYSANCPGSAIEFQAAGTPVVSTAYRGMLDTVQDGQTGLLGKTEDDIRDNIIYLLQNQEASKRMGANGVQFVRQRFGYKKICEEWLETFNRLSDGEPLPDHALKNKYHNYKYVREGLRVSKSYIPFGDTLPCLTRLREIASRVK